MSGDYTLEIFLGIEEFLIHLEDGNEHHRFCVLGDVELSNSPSLVLDLLDNSCMIEVVPSVIDCDTIEILEEVFK